MISRGSFGLLRGDYRVLYAIDDAKQTIIIVHVGHRRDVDR